MFTQIKVGNVSAKIELASNDSDSRVVLFIVYGLYWDHPDLLNYVN